MMTSKNGRASFSASSSALLAVPYSVTPGESRNFDLTTSSHIASNDSTTDPAYLYSQLKSVEWVQRYGLKSQKLTFDQILQQIGFKRVESFDPVIGKTVSAKYAGNLYHEIQHDNGDRYVLTCRPEKLREYHHRLIKMLNLLRKRLVFISNGSRRLFGIIGEPSVCLICDCKTFDHRIFNQFQTALTSLLKEQISKIKRFNIIWVSDDNEQFREQPIEATSSNIDKAIDWICDKKCPRNKISISSTCEAVLKAYTNNAHSVYLITEGDSSDYAREMLRDNIVKTRLSTTTPIPLHVVSLFCHNNDTQIFLRSIAQSADGSYFCYKIKNEISDLKAPSNLNDPTRIQLQDDKLQIGTNALTPLPEYPLDITLMYKEIIQCQSIIDRLEKILGFIRDENQNPIQPFDATKSAEGFNNSGESNFQRSLIVQSSTLFNHEENEMSSEDWLKIYGIDAQKLDFFSVLQSAAFRHCDGVITLLKPPEDSDDVTAETPANPKDKLINAIYCDQFAHVTWPDGTIRHVHVTPELHRDYERRIKTLLEKIRTRLLYLKKGSRDVFGTVLESNIYVLIDTSKSMEHHLGFVKEKLRLLIQDQLFAKERVNMVAFNSVINPWRDRLTKMNDTTTYSQLQPWIDGLNAEGTTNTLAALRFALADPATEAIYLLTDGRPDQNERHILSQVQYRQIVPIHTIAFNCQDQTANQFLYDLAKQTGGRFHAFKYGFERETAIEIPESEDVGNLKREFERGEKELQRIAALRDECLGKAWARDNVKSNKIRNSKLLQLKSHSTLDIAFRPSSSSMSQGRNKKKRSTTNKSLKHRSKSVTNFSDQKNIIDLNPNQWLLPETQEYLKRNDKQQKSTTADADNEHESVPVQIKKTPTPYDEVKSYLKKNSLLAKALTIFDVLYPTTITIREPRHIQVIDRFVLAKVWDDILPLAYGSYVGKLRLVNHYAVDLGKYEASLRELIKDYYQFTSKFIWEHLKDDDKLKVAPSLYWNSLVKDDQTKFTQEIPKDEHTSQNALENFVWTKLDRTEQNEFLKKLPNYEDDNKTLLKNLLNEDDYAFILKGVNRMDVEINRAIKFLQIATDLRLLQKRADLESKPTDKPKPERPRSVDRTYNQRVLCRFDDDGFFYSGTTRKSRHGRILVRFDTGSEQEAVGHILLPINGAIAQPNLFVNDCVLARQRNGDREFWAPAIIIMLPSTTARPPPSYTIQIYTPSPHRDHVLRRDMIKISFGLFQRTLLYLQNIDNPPIGCIPVSNPLSPSTLEQTIRKEIEPLTQRIIHIDETNTKRYHKLKSVLGKQMNLIKNLEETSITTVQRRRRSHHTEEVSIKTDGNPTISPKPPTPTRPKRLSPTVTPKPTPTPVTPKTPPISTPRRDLIRKGTSVYAMWFDDDSLVYEGTVLSEPDDTNIYEIQRDDLPDTKSMISRDHIYLKSECRPLHTFKEKSFALVKYPKEYCGCWKPAVILQHDHNRSEVIVRYYDCDDENISNKIKAIEIDKDTFQSYATYRINFEKKLVGQVIVGLNETTKTYLLGTIIDRLKSGHRYKIRWYDDTESNQEEEHLFGAFIRRNNYHRGDRVLALDEDDYTYKPARIKKLPDDSDDRKTLNVCFTDPEETEEIQVPVNTTFVITDLYYRNFIQTLYT